MTRMRGTKPAYFAAVLATAAVFAFGFVALTAGTAVLERISFSAMSSVYEVQAPTPSQSPSAVQTPSETPTQTSSHFPPGVICASAREGRTEVVTIKVACTEGVIESLPFVFYGSPVGSCAAGGFVVDNPACEDPSFPSYAVSRCIGLPCCWLSTRSRPDPCHGKVCVRLSTRSLSRSSRTAQRLGASPQTLSLHVKSTQLRLCLARHTGTTLWQS